MTGSVSNILAIWDRSLQYEREEGSLYYCRQRERLRRRAEREGLPVPAVVAAFAALSPNNAKSTNYRALDTCLDIVAGRLPEDSRVIAYSLNKKKALSILRGRPIEKELRGRKVYAFYRNTLNPDSEEFVTVDGHMLGVWVGKRMILRREAEIKPTLYPIIAEDFRNAAKEVSLSTPKFQATIWIAWKRINNILWRPPQMEFPWVEQAR